LEGAVATPPTVAEYRWAELVDATHTVISAPLDWEGERVLLAITRFEGALPLSESSELPHSMSPEDMLKSLAIQALGKWTGLTHLKEMQRVEATTVSPVLRSIIRTTIRQAQPIKDV